MIKKIVLWAIVVFALIQLIPVDRKNPEVVENQNYINLVQTPAEVQNLLKNACYDCHSNETVYPKYAYIAPISWSIKNHVNDGRKYLNFSVWATYNKDIKTRMLTRASEVVENGRMPLPSYISYHPEAELTEKQRQLLKEYFEAVMVSGMY